MKELSHNLGRRVDYVLAVIQEDQHVPVAAAISGWRHVPDHNDWRLISCGSDWSLLMDAVQLTVGLGSGILVGVPDNLAGSANAASLGISCAAPCNGWRRAPGRERTVGNG